ncbi:hypothetical protein GCM10011519_14190 [Marmoricola endophyticus]|uniref:Uncharacterized protein n=1 Tax=Marmoricola endophyticus TaxID=2040280 RepID=A0A917BIH5_9ACTN|nr:hypothetical protein [Marmoricola endophyticus]GGF41539.1 hypothetical protein GCM10011519_14190 [Marmoricola endophyticus]
MNLNQEREVRTRHRRRGPLPPRGRLDRTADRALSSQLDLARMLYGAHGR